MVLLTLFNNNDFYNRIHVVSLNGKSLNYYTVISTLLVICLRKWQLCSVYDPMSNTALKNINNVLYRTPQA